MIDIQQVMAEIEARAVRGLTAGCIELANEAKRIVSVPAPRRLVTSGPRSKHPGIRYYVATTEATPGAPPRKLSDHGRARITWEVDKEALAGRVGLNVPYMRRHELVTNHPWLSLAAQNMAPRLLTILGDGMSATMGHA